MSTADVLGPPLDEVAPSDREGLRLLFQEQRARIAFVQQNAAWRWFGGVPLGFGSPRAALRGVLLSLGAVVVMAAALVIAGFTRGPVLWGTLALLPVLWVARDLLTGRHERATLRFYRRARLLPAVIVARRPQPGDASIWLATAALAPKEPDPQSFAALLAAADRLRMHLDGIASMPELTAVAETIRNAPETAFDGSRIPLPPQLGEGLDLAHFALPPVDDGEAPYAPRLVFVLADPHERRRGHTRAVSSQLWGSAGEFLCAALPWEAQR